MSFSTTEKIANLLQEVASLGSVKAIGQTGDINEVPKAGESDIDLFVFCDAIPDTETRRASYGKVNTLFEQCSMTVCEGGDWGTGDVFSIDGVDTMLMYFTVEETLRYTEDVLAGNHLHCVGGFYPVGRLATLRNIHSRYDESSFLASVKERLAVYPDSLKEKMVNFHLGKAYDAEDFGRAIRRKDVLFYHQVFESALDHYLQAFFAANKTYFPSRKRTKQYIDGFVLKPENCYERLMEAIRLGSEPGGIEKSVEVWRGLVEELKGIIQ